MQLFCKPASDIFDSFYREYSEKLPPISFRRISERPDLVRQGLRAATEKQQRIVVWLDPDLGPALERRAAHEMLHHILEREGFPRKYVINEEDERETALAKKVCNVVLDLEIERRLDEAGFDPTANRYSMKEGILKRVRGYKGKEPSLSSELGRELAIDFLEAKLLLTKSDFEKIDTAYRRRFPRLRLIGDRLVRIVKENGYSTPPDSCRSINSVLEQLGLKVKFKYTALQN